MIRNIKLYGALKKATEHPDFRLDVDNEQHLIAALRSQCNSLDLAVRSGPLAIVASDASGKTLKLDEGFNYGKDVDTLHIVLHSEGGYGSEVLIAIEVAVIVSAASIIITRLLTKGLSTNPNGSGGAKSTMFNGAVNSTDQGGPIPQIYGKKVLVGTTIIAADEDSFNTV
jgi:predicted phage tail protein